MEIKINHICKIVCFIFFTKNILISQQNTNTFNLIINAGLAPAQIHGDTYSGFHKVGAIAGLGIEREFNSKIKSSLLFWFIQKGSRKNQDIAKNDFTAYYVNLNYIEVPLIVTFTQKKYLFDVGLSAAYLINYVEGNQNGNITGMYPFKKFDYSLKIGLGYNINKQWFANFRTSNSFITTRPNFTKQKIYYNNIIARTFNNGYYNNVLEITIGYRFKPNKKSE